MSALTANRINMPTPNLLHTLDGLVGAAQHIYKNALIACVGGYWVNVTATTGLEGKYALCMDEVDNSLGGNGDKPIKVQFIEPKMCVLVKNDTVSPITQAQIGGDGYALDNQTVSADDNGATRSVLGTPWMFFEANRRTVTTSVWVEVK